tara:strand:- start:13 stop:675 length:663 start_codon:yes stop_codon:yes gene_type:complete
MINVMSKFEIAYNDPKLYFIYKDIKAIKDIKILELGVRKGISTSLFLKLCEENNGKLISVDVEDCGHLYKNDRWNFIHTRDDNFEKIDSEILKMGGLDVVYIDSFHEPLHIKKIFYHYYKLLNKGGLIFIDDICWLPYAKFSSRESRGMHEANYQTFKKLLEIKFNNKEKLNLEFSFDNSGTAKMTKKSDFELNEPKKVKKVFSFKSTLLAFYNKLVNRS